MALDDRWTAEIPHGADEGMSPTPITIALLLFAGAQPAAQDAESLFQQGLSILESQQDAKESTRCFRKAAELGHAKAQYALGAAYAAGRGVRKDPLEAYAWIRLSASPGADERTESVLAGLSKSLTPEQLIRANQLAVRRKQQIEKRRSIHDVRKR